jgi:alkylated DNA nucleotide flippase Atl1
MTTTRCIHGLDSRFCAVCNRSSTRRTTARSSAPADTSLPEILEFLNDARTRATYGAVAQVLGVPPRSIGAMLGARRPEASWVVNAETELPTDYEQSDWHDDLLASSDVIRTGHELTLKLTLWRTRRT